MKIGQTLIYFKKEVKVIEFNQTHVLVEFKNDTKLCTNKNTFSK